MKKTPAPAHHQLSVTADVVIFTLEDNELKALLIKRNNPPFESMWALPGGFLKPKETSEEAGMRVLHDKAGTSKVYLEQLYTFDDPKRDPRGQIVSISYFALLASQNLKISQDKQTQTPTLFSVNKLPKLAFDHKQIVGYALKRLRAKLEYTNVVYALLPKHFTMTELQSTYEAILGKKLDKRNFQKKFLSLGLVRKTNQKRDGFNFRPAALYEFTDKSFQELKKFF